MARYLSIGPIFQGRGRNKKKSRLLEWEFWRAVGRALCFYFFYAVVFFVIFFDWPSYGRVYLHYWQFLDRNMLVFLPLVLGLSWFFSITMALVLPYPQLKDWEGGIEVPVPPFIITTATSVKTNRWGRVKNFFLRRKPAITQNEEAEKPGLTGAEVSPVTIDILNDTSTSSSCRSSTDSLGDLETSDEEEEKEESGNQLQKNQKKQKNDEKKKKRKVEAEECAVIIPTHNSAGVVPETIAAASRYFPMKNLYIMDNGVQRGPNNIETERVVKEISEEINYCFFPIPSKAVNLYLGSVVAAPHFKYLFLLDDDTLFPEGFCWPSVPISSRLTKNKNNNNNNNNTSQDLESQQPTSEGLEEEDHLSSTTSYGFSICGVNRERRREGLVVKLQDWEYKIAGYRKYVQAETSSTFFHHGAIGFWERRAYQETWKRHYALPLGDDRLSGMENLFLGKRMGYIAAQTPFQTIVPEQLVWARKGTFWTVFKQRAFRWNVANFRHLWLDALLFFTYIPRKSTPIRTILATVFFRVFIVLELMSMYITISMPIALVFLLQYNWDWWLIIHAALYVSAFAQGLFSNYVIMRKRPDLRVEWHILFLAPLYRFALRWFRLVGIFVSGLVYVPLYPLPIKVEERPEVQTVISYFQATGNTILPSLPKDLDTNSFDKYTLADMKLQAQREQEEEEEEEPVECEVVTHDPPIPPCQRIPSSSSSLSITHLPGTTITIKELSPLPSTSSPARMRLSSSKLTNSLSKLSTDLLPVEELLAKLGEPLQFNLNKDNDSQVMMKEKKDDGFQGEEEDEVPPPPPPPLLLLASSSSLSSVPSAPPTPPTPTLNKKKEKHLPAITKVVVDSKTSTPTSARLRRHNTSASPLSRR